MSVSLPKNKLAIIRIHDSKIINAYKDVLNGEFFSLDSTKGVTSTTEISVTDFPVHTGEVKVGQVAKRPGTLTLQGLMGEVHFKSYRRGNVSLSRLRSLLDELTQNACFLTIYTEDKVYKNYIILTASVGRPNLGTMDVSLQLREALTYSPKLTQVKIPMGGLGTEFGSLQSKSNAKIIADSLYSKIEREFLKIKSGEEHRASVYEACSNIVLMGVDYKLAAIAQTDEEAGVPILMTSEQKMTKVKWDSQPSEFKSFVTMTKSVSEFPNWWDHLLAPSGGVRMVYYKMPNFIMESWSLPKWDSSINGPGILGLRLEINPSNFTISVPEGSNIWKEVLSGSDEFKITRSADVRIHKVEGKIHDGITGFEKQFAVTVADLERLAGTSTIAETLSFLLLKGDNWVFRSSLLEFASPYGWLYSASWKRKSNSFPLLPVVELHPQLVLIHPELERVIKTVIADMVRKGLWKKQWTSVTPVRIPEASPTTTPAIQPTISSRGGVSERRIEAMEHVIF